jgi:uncharacterized membrane protein YfcA
MTTGAIAFVLCVFFVAGIVKGLVGIGLPTITLALTSFVLPLSDMIALIALPTVVTNLWQAATGGNFRKIVRRQLPLILPMVVTLLLTMYVIGRKTPQWAFLVLASILVIYGGLGLLRIRLRIHADLERPLAPVIGLISGGVAGLIGVPVVPLMPYMQGLDIKPAELVQSFGVIVSIASLFLTASLIYYGLLDYRHVMISGLAIVPAVSGQMIGAWIRQRLSIEQFRIVVFWALFLTGLYTFAARLL